MASSSRSNRWLRIESLFYAAFELKEGRQAFLDEACGADLELRQEVESLLHSAGQTIGFLQQPVLQAVQDASAEEEAVCGKRIGAYQLLRLLGEGGMGKVYLAARADDLFARKWQSKSFGVDSCKIEPFSCAFVVSGRFWQASIIPTSRDCWMAALPTRDCPT